MPAVNKPKYSKSEVSQEFNLKELLGYSPTNDQKELFYDLVVEKMVERTTSGKDIDNRKFTQYSPEYAKMKGVSRKSVDLVLNGDMLSSFEESSTSNPDIVKIMVKDSKDGVETLKSYNHNTGDTVPARTYFGINGEKDIDSVISEVDSIREGVDETQQALTLEDFLGNITTSQGRENQGLRTVFDILGSDI